MYSIDTQKPNKITLSLAKPNKTIVANLRQVINENLQIKTKEVNQLSFVVPYYISIDNKKVKNPHIDLIKNKYLILSKYNGIKEWFIIDSIEKTSDTNSDVTVNCFSLPHHLSQIDIKGYEKTGVNCKIVSDDILRETGWKTGYINPKFNLKYRHFEFNSVSKLNAIFNVAETYGAIVIFDTENNLVSYYEEGELSKYKGFNISHGHYIQNIKEVIDSKEIVTRLYVYGHNGLTINSVNPTGQSYIDDFSYFLHPFEMDENGTVISHSDYMSDELAIALVTYNKNTSSKKNDFYTLLQEKKSLQEQITDIKNEIFDLDVELQIILDSIAINKKIGESNTGLNKQRDQLNNQIKEKKSQINDIENQIKQIDTNIENLKKELTLEANLSSDLLEELSKFIQTDDWTNDSLYDPNDLYEAGVEQISKVNTPPINITSNLVNFIEILSEKHNWERFWIGDIVRVNHKILGIDLKLTLSEINFDFNNSSIGITVSNTKKDSSPINKIENSLYTISKVNTDYNERKINWDKVAYNFNIRNDRIDKKPVNPVLNNKSFKYESNDDGTINIVLNWEYPDYNTTKKDEDNIDGFLIYLYYDSENEPYQFGSKMAEETIIDISLYTKSYSFPSVPANLFYTIGISAYRRVDNDVNHEGILISDIVRFNDHYGQNINQRSYNTIQETPPRSFSVSNSEVQSLSQPIQPKQEINIKNAKINNTKFSASYNEPTNPELDEVWLDLNLNRFLVWNGTSWDKDVEIQQIENTLTEHQAELIKLENELKLELEENQKILDESMERVEEELKRIETEVLPEVEQAIKNTEIPYSFDPPEEIPPSGLYWDTSVNPPRLMRWDEKEGRYVVVAPTENEIQNMIDNMRSSVEREARVYSKLEIAKTKKYLIDRLHDEIGDIAQSIQGLLDIKDELIDLAENIDTILDEYDGKFSSFEHTIDELQGQVTTTITDIERIDTTVQGHSTEIQQNAQQIAAKVDSVIYERDKTGLLSSIERNETNISLLSDEINLRVTRDEYNTGINGVGDRITSTETSITQISDAISLKADRSELTNYVDKQTYTNKMASLDVSINGINGKVTSIETDINSLDGQMTSALSQIAQVDVKADGISSSVSELRGEFDDAEARLSLAETSITQLSDQISLKASQTSVNNLTQRMTQAESEIELMPDKISLAVRDGIEGLEVGGSNLARGTNTDAFVKYGSGATVSIVEDSPTNIVRVDFVSKATGGLQQANPYRTMELVEGETYTLSFDVRGKLRGSLNYVYIIHNGTNNQSVSLNESTLSENTFKRVHATFTKRYDAKTSYVMISATSDAVEIGDWFEVKNIQVEKGNKATDWGLAEEDRVNKTNVLSSINLSPEGIKIQGNKIDIVGLVSVLNADGTTGTMINGNKLITGSVTANRLNINEVFGNSAVIAKIQADSVLTANLNATKITTGTLNAANVSIVNLNANSITSGTLDASKVNVTNLNASKITTGTLNAANVSVINLSASNIKSGTLDASVVNVANINANNIKSGTLDAINVKGITGTFGKVSVVDGDFTLKDNTTGAETIINTGSNIVFDHSFELIRPHTALEPIDPSNPYVASICSVDTSSLSNFFGMWNNTNPSNARIARAFNAESRHIFSGLNSVVLRGQSYGMWDQICYIPEQVRRTNALSLSCYVAPFEKTTTNVEVSLRIQVVNQSGAWVQDLASASYEINHTKKYNWQRVSVTYKGSLNIGSNRLRVRLMLNNNTSSAMLLCDGVQLVPFDHPTLYEPETSLFNFMNGIGAAPGPTLDTVNVLNYADVRDLHVSKIHRHAHAFFQLQNGWTNYGGDFQPARYSKQADGVVYLSGMIRNGTMDTVAGRLPAGCRPNRVEAFAVATGGTGTGMVYVYPNGDVIPKRGGAWISLSGITFLGEN